MSDTKSVFPSYFVCQTRIQSKTSNLFHALHAQMTYLTNFHCDSRNFYEFFFSHLPVIECQIKELRLRLIKYLQTSIQSKFEKVRTEQYIRNQQCIFNVIIMIVLFLTDQEGRKELISFLILLGERLGSSVQRILHRVDLRRREFLPSRSRYPLQGTGVNTRPILQRHQKSFPPLKIFNVSPIIFADRSLWWLWTWRLQTVTEFRTVL